MFRSLTKLWAQITFDDERTLNESNLDAICLYTKYFVQLRDGFAFVICAFMCVCVLVCLLFVLLCVVFLLLLLLFMLFVSSRVSNWALAMQKRCVQCDLVVWATEGTTSTYTRSTTTTTTQRPMRVYAIMWMCECVLRVWIIFHSAKQNWAGKNWRAIDCYFSLTRTHNTVALWQCPIRHITNCDDLCDTIIGRRDVTYTHCAACGQAAAAAASICVCLCRVRFARLFREEREGGNRHSGASAVRGTYVRQTWCWWCAPCRPYNDLRIIAAAQCPFNNNNAIYEVRLRKQLIERRDKCFDHHNAMQTTTTLERY